MAEDPRLDRVEDGLASLQVATAAGLSEVRTELRHLRELVETSVNRPAPPVPWYLAAIAGSSFVTATAVLVLVIAQAFR